MSMLKNPKTNCFAYLPDGCVATINRSCKKCPFFKTQAQFNADYANSIAYIEKKYGKPYEQFAAKYLK